MQIQDQEQEAVRRVIAEVTRYPLELLTPGADLEEDLGIDSVKRAEIIAVLQQRLGLPENLGLAGNPQRIRTVGDVASVVARLRGAAAAVAPKEAALPPAPPAPPPRATLPTTSRTAPVTELPLAAVAPPLLPAVTPPLGSAADTDLQALVIGVFGEVTRYPHELLTPGADLEEDLGIDSVKRAEIVAVLKQRLDLPEAPMTQTPTAIRTIADIVNVIAALRPAPTPARPATTGLPSPASAPTRPLAPAPAAQPFAGRVAFISGSGHGIGKVIAQKLARQGATVLVNSFHSRERGEQVVAELRADGSKAHHLWGSVANQSQLAGIFSTIEKEYGYLDFFISNASNGIIAPLDEVTTEQWERAFRTNVIALHQGAYLARPLMKRRGGGKIVCISSPGAQRYIEYFGCMGTVKAALESLARYLAVELGPDNIQVNAVSAGPIHGELLQKYPSSERLIPYWESLTAGQQLGSEEDVAELVLFLLSSGAAKISGSTLLLDGAGSQRI